MKLGCPTSRCSCETWEPRISGLFRKDPAAAKPLRPRDIKAIRQSLNAGQVKFARLLNVSPNTVESCEQGIRQPRHTALKLLSIAQRHPEILLEA